MGTIDKFRGFMGDLLHNGKMYPPIGSPFCQMEQKSPINPQLQLAIINPFLYSENSPKEKLNIPIS